MSTTTEANTAGLEQFHEEQRGARVCRMEELVFLTEIYGLDMPQAIQQLGVTEETGRRYLKDPEWPDCRARVLAVYT